MKRIMHMALGAISLLAFQTPVFAADTDPEKADQFLECLSIAEDQRERDPDPEMKRHWAQYSQVYAANVFTYAGDIKYAFEHIQEKFAKWDNMRNFIPAQSINNLSLALLKKCDEIAVEHLDRVGPYQDALAVYLKARDEAKAKEAAAPAEQAKN